MAKKNTAMAKWDAELAAAADESCAVTAGIGGATSFKTAGGILKFGDSEIPGNAMGVIVIDHVLENKFFVDAYADGNAAAPACYAYGRGDGLTPHAAIKDPVCETCAACDNNKFGSADTGKGKACGNRVRLACIPAGKMVKGRFEPNKPTDISEADIGYLSIPPTSIKAWKKYVEDLRATAGRPSWAVFTKIALVPDAKKQFAVTFDLIKKAGPEFADVLTRRHGDEMKVEFQAYPDQEEAPVKKGRAKKVPKKTKKKKDRFAR